MWGRKKMATTAVGGGGQGFSKLEDSAGDPVAPMANLSFGNTPGELASPSLRDVVRSRLLTDMIRSFGNEPSGVIMLVDSLTVKLVSSALKMSEMLDENIQLVENITMKDKYEQYLKRQSLPNMTACYFITPTVESVNRLLFDYRDKKKPMYGAVHLYFTSRVSEALLSKLKLSPAMARIAAFKELNLEFVIAEENVFTLKSPCVPRKSTEPSAPLHSCTRCPCVLPLRTAPPRCPSTLPLHVAEGSPTAPRGSLPP